MAVLSSVSLSSILSHSRKIGILFYIIGIVWFTMLSFDDFNHRTYLSENALLPGLADEFYVQSNEHLQLYDKLKAAASKNDDSSLRQLIYSELQKSNIDVAQQNFTLDMPDLLGEQTVSGMNTYGILRSPGTARTEAILFSVPLRTESSPEQETIAGIAMTIMLISSLRRMPHVAKDIVLVFPEMEFVGMQAFLDAYHGTETSRFVKFSDLIYRSGSIQAGLSFEIAGPSISYIEPRIEGLNGIMPNLDLINMISVLAEKHGCQMRFQGETARFRSMGYHDMKQSMITITSLMRRLATGSPSGLHGLMLAFQIPAVTLVSPKPRRNQDSVDLETGVKMVEGIFRSLNSLQERFHQSFFFYLLPKLHRYVSIGVYTPPFFCIHIGVILHVFDLWLQMRSSSTSGKSKVESSGDEMKAALHFSRIVPVAITASVFGVCTYAGGSFFLRVGRPFGVEAGAAMFTGLFAVFSGAMLSPYLLKRKNKQLVSSDSRLLKWFASFTLCLFLGCLGIINISLATFLAVALVPATLLVQASRSTLCRLLNSLVLLMVSPLSILAFACYTERYFQRNYVGVLRGMQRSLIQGWVEKEILGSWTYGLLALIVFPIWVLLWSVVWSRDSSETKVDTTIIGSS